METIVAEEPQTLLPEKAGAPAPVRRRHMSFWGVAWDVLIHRPTGLIGLLILVFFAAIATFGPMFYPEHLATDPFHSFAAPSWQHPLGTDFDGTDTLALIVTGSRYVLLSAFLAGLFTAVFGSIAGLVSGYYLGIADSALMRLADFVLTIPGFPLLIVLSTIWKFGDPLSMGLVLGAIGWGALARAVRAQVLTLRERTFVEAARGLGFSSTHIIVKEIFPNIGSYIAMKFLLAVTGAMYASIGLFFLGVLPFKVNNWGVMLNFAFTQSGAMYSSSALAYLLSPLFAILLVTLGVVLFLDAVDEMLNPRLRRG
jgi:peptide/nickel transport system permease protein